MTRAIPFTQATLRRAIAAARKAGLRVVGIRPDGTVIVEDPADMNDSPGPNDALERERKIVL